MDDWYDEAMKELEEEFEAGNLTYKQFNKEVIYLNEEYEEWCYARNINEK